jgi:TRAP transporter 4TM/12TM fusion protein
MPDPKENESKALKWVITLAGVTLGLFHLYAVYVGTMSLMIQREVHIGMVLVVSAFLLWKKLVDGGAVRWFHRAEFSAIIGISLAIMAYLISIDDEIVMHLGMPTQMEIVMAILLTVCLLDMTRRQMGWAMPIIAIIAIAYAFLGPHMPFDLSHRGYGLTRLTSYLFLSDDGIYGVATSASASVVVMFIMLGSFLEASGAEIIFQDGAFALLGRVRGGPAKGAVIASALMGTISGSAIANVVTTGTFTIPLMKRSGYPPHFAGAVEAVASTGGQIMPPIMGAAAFIMASVIGVPYSDIVVASIIPAFLYFFMCFIAVDLQAGKMGMKGLPAEDLPKLRDVFKKGWPILLTLAILIYMLLGPRITPIKTAFYCCGISIVMSWFVPGQRIGVKKFFMALENTAKGIITVALACGTAGIIIGVMGLTGLGLKISSLLTLWAGGNLIILLILTMFTGIILGMGLPTVGVYIVLSVLVAPALVGVGVDPLSAHFFIFYYGVLAVLTPPVALAAYAAASIAGSDMSKTGWTAVRLGLAGFIIPYVAVFSPAVLMQGKWTTIIQVSISCIIGISALAVAFQGYPIENKIMRLLLIIGSILLLDPGSFTDILGAGLILAIFIFKCFSTRAKKLSQD